MARRLLDGPSDGRRDLPCAALDISSGDFERACHSVETPRIVLERTVSAPLHPGHDQGDLAVDLRVDHLLPVDQPTDGTLVGRRDDLHRSSASRRLQHDLVERVLHDALATGSLELRHELPDRVLLEDAGDRHPLGVAQGGHRWLLERRQ